MMDHDPGVGGRFSVLTNVGLLPAAVCGLDIGAIRAGAADALAPVLPAKPPAEVPAAVGAALAWRSRRRKPIAVMMAYADRLERFTRWYVQLWAESLGKDGKGTTPLGGARPGRPAQPAAALHRRSARQAVHHRHRRRRPAAARA